MLSSKSKVISLIVSLLVVMQFTTVHASDLTCSGLFKEALSRDKKSEDANPISSLMVINLKLKHKLPISAYIEIIGYKKFYDSNGVEVGVSTLFQPIQHNINNLKESRSGLDKYRTEIDEHNSKLFEKMGFKESEDPIFGKYMSEVPNPKLFEYLRAQYNARAPADMQINMGLYQSKVVSAHQTEYVKHWVKDGTMALSDPKWGSVFGLKPAQLSENITEGKERNSLYRHDLEHFASIFLIPKKIIDTNRQIGSFWEKVLRHMRSEIAKGKVLKGSPEWRAMMDDVYIYNRRFHSLTHLLGILVRSNGSVDVNSQEIKDFGFVARVETPTIHWVGLGYRPNWVTRNSLPFESRLLSLGLEQSVVANKNITITDAYAAVTNEGIQQAIHFVNKQKNLNYKAIYQNFLAETKINNDFELRPEELTELEQLTLRRYRIMGN